MLTLSYFLYVKNKRQNWSPLCWRHATPFPCLLLSKQELGVYPVCVLTLLLILCTSTTRYIFLIIWKFDISPLGFQVFNSFGMNFLVQCGLRIKSLHNLGELVVPTSFIDVHVSSPLTCNGFSIEQQGFVYIGSVSGVFVLQVTSLWLIPPFLK